jgi:hypothetical protein
VLWLPWSYTASGADVTNPRQTRAAVISPEVFAATDVVPAAGRLLIPADSTNSERVAVLSYEFWQRAYGGSSSLIGKKINLNLVPHTLVGSRRADSAFLLKPSRMRGRQSRPRCSRREAVPPGASGSPPGCSRV